MNSFRIAALTIFALPFPFAVVLFSVHCHSAGFPVNSSADSNVNLSFDSEAPISSVAAGQSITNLILSPATLSEGRESTGTILLRYPAPSGGVVIDLQNSDRAKASAPSQVTIAEGMTKGSFRVSSRPVSNLVSLNLSATYQSSVATSNLTLLPAPRREWFVSPDARGGDGSQKSPWDLTTALAHGPTRKEIRPGDTIWLRAGRYTGTYVSMLNGTETQPVIVRALPGERVVIDKAEVNDQKQPALKVKGSWVWFWGIEIMNSNLNRQRNSPYTGQDQPWRGAGIDVYAPQVKFINMIFHDNGQGIWDKQNMTEIHGCLFFYNGNNKREHGLYIGNRTGTKYITDNVLFAQGGYGILAHSDSSSSSQKGLHLEGNISFNNGIITNDDQKTGNLQVGGVEGQSAERIVIKDNHIYNTQTNATNKNQGMRLGYEDNSNKDVELLNNYIVSQMPLRLWWWTKARVEGNTIYSTGDELVEVKMPAGINVSSYKWDINNYFSSSGALTFARDKQTYGFAQWRQGFHLDQRSQAATGRPKGLQVFVRPNRYEPGRANIVVYNWDRKDMVEMDLRGVLTRGAQFEIRDTQDYFGKPVVSGIYDGGTLRVPMKLSTVTRPIGNVERFPQHTSPEFNVFVVQTTAIRSGR